MSCRLATRFLILILLALIAKSHAASSATLSDLSTTPHRFPLNLRRPYDGTWESVGDPPFAKIPDSSDVTNRSSTRTQPSSPKTDISFLKQSGFTLLTADNHPLSIHPSLHIVFGDLMLRDGSYRTPRDVTMRMIGVYELDTGTLVVVGDVYFADERSTLQRLYSAFIKARPSDAQHTPFKLSQDQFVHAFSPRFSKYHKQFHPHRPSSRHAGIASYCPFSASFKITPRKYEDSAPTDDLPSGAPFDSNDAPGGGRVPMPGASMFAGRTDGMTDGAKVQDELVEMKGHFVSEACDTKMNVVLTTLDTGTLFGKAINYTLLVTIVAFIQVIVLIRQMEMTSTQVRDAFP